MSVAQTGPSVPRVRVACKRYSVATDCRITKTTHIRQQIASLHILVSIGLVLLLNAVSSPAPAQMIVAHRGASAAAPENTLAAFSQAWKMEADAIEGDFYLTADGHIVAIHDDTTKRTANANLRVAKSSLAELKRLDFGSWKSPQYRGERIPTLAEVLAIVPPDKKLLIEIKCGPEIVLPLKKALAASSLKPSQTIVIAFNEEVVQQVKQQLPRLKVYWLVSYRQDETTGKWSPTLNEVLAGLKRTGCDGLDTQANTEVVDTAFIRAVRQAGYELHTWTIDDPELARHYAQLKVDSITTNRPQLIKERISPASAVN